MTPGWQRTQCMPVVRWWHEPECQPLRGVIVALTGTVQNRRQAAAKFKRV